MINLKQELEVWSLWNFNPSLGVCQIRLDLSRLFQIIRLLNEDEIRND